jgi:general secretion pathway protein C
MERLAIISKGNAMKRLPVFVSFMLFIVLCISGTYWATRLFKPPVRPVAAPPPVAHVEVNMAAASALFGGRPAAAAVASNFQLKGVVVADKPEDSVAILSADGKPPQSVPLNAEVLPGVTVKEVHAKYVVLSDGGVNKRVELPEGQQLHVDAVGSDTAAQPAPPMTMAPPMETPPTAPQSLPPGMNPNPNGPFNMKPRVPGG